MKKYFYLSTFIILSTFFILGFSNPSEEKSNKDIIKFSHQLHSELSDCASCHEGVAESTSLNDRLLPVKDNCATCHDVEDTETCELCHYTDIYEPLIQKKSELLFSHKLHASDPNLSCETCHQGFEKVAYSFEAFQPNPLMNQCYTCHNSNGTATMVCEACHLSTTDLVPQDHKLNNFPDSHRFSAMDKDADCAMCHDDVFCSDCHIATTGLTETNSANDFYRPLSPHSYVDGAKQQKINRVHDLNYVFTHGIDLKNKETECQTCHQTETFCVECHSANNSDFSLSGVTPLSHKSPTFFTLGRGSGGGDHAILAKRDIERCASCHDTNGADPNCITCHTDADGIKGTDPKTHDFNYMNDVNGDWHNDAGSLCYNCHISSTPSSQKNIAFCGYCHTSN